jgi:HAD superfamily hydrolase (TIGR01509 family)
MCIDKNQLKDFDYHFYSNSLKMSKPNNEIYQHVCDHISSKNILFIDDKQENLNAAESYGIDTILFNSDDYASGLIEQKILNFLN